jgi:MFS transporter, AAHS family, benzoate transport protein
MTKIDVAGFISGLSFNKFHVGMLFWSCLIVVFDMYDLVVFGAVLPVLMQDWGMTPVQAGAIGSAGLVGMMIGAIVFGSLADRFGRRNVLTFSVALFSAATVLCGVAGDPTAFTAFRFIAGLGIGGILPSVIAMVTDYAPKGMASTLVGIVMCAFSVGGILAPLVAMNLIPAFGWQSVYWVAAIPLVLLPFMVRCFVDSPATLVQTGRQDALRTILDRMAPASGLPRDAELEIVQEAKPTGAPILELFRHGRALGTVMVWIAFFMCLLMVNGLSTWLPKLMVESGYALDSSLTFSIVMNIGAIIGTLVLGRAADSWGVKKVLVPMYVVSAVALTLLGFGSGFALLLALAFVTGATTMGSQNISYSFVSQYYPSPIRSTAIGLASGVGRLGAIFGPAFGGLMLGTDLPIEASFVAFAVPGVFAALAFLFVPLGKGAGQASPALDGTAPVDPAAPGPDRTAVSAS